MISYARAYGSSFFNDSMQPYLFEKNRTYGLPVFAALTICTACEIPFQTIAYEFGLSKCLSYHVNNQRKHHVFPIPPPKVRSQLITRLALSLLFVIPLKMISLLVKIQLLIFSQEFRVMQRHLTEYHLARKTEQPTLEAVLKVLNPIWTSWSWRFAFSNKELNQMGVVCRDFRELSLQMWQNKIATIPGQQQQNPIQYVKDQLAMIKKMHPPKFITLMGGEEEILKLPTVTAEPYQLTTLLAHAQANELFGKSSILRYQGYSEIVFHCREVRKNEVRKNMEVKKGFLSLSPKSLNFGKYTCLWKREGRSNKVFCKMEKDSLENLLAKKESQWVCKLVDGCVPITLMLIDPPQRPS